MSFESQIKVAALAGRRIDGADSTRIQFPLSCVKKVTGDLRKFFEVGGFTSLVCSAACGADLVAVESAKLLGMTIDIVLPYSPSKFRGSSVVDRPGDWGPKYDRLIDESAANNRLHILSSDEDGNYDLATTGILSIATAMAPLENIIGVVVWEGQPRDEGDATLDFKRRAEKLGLIVHELATC